MKAVYLNTACALAITFGLAACVSSASTSEAQTIAAEPVITPAPSPAPPPPPQPTPAPAPAPPPVLFDNWVDRPQTQGSWRYMAEPNETFAQFIAPNRRPLAIVRCDLDDRVAGIGRYDNPSTLPVEMLIGTEFGRELLTATQRLPEVGVVAADIAPDDPLLDALALSRGRFAIALSGQNPLYLPAWAEVTRVIEDCR